MTSVEKANKKKPISTPLRQERELRGWSRNYVAERLEVDVMTVGRWERGERLPHPYHRQKLCDLFEKNAQELGLLPEAPKASNDQKIVSDSPLQISSSPLHIPSSNEKTTSSYLQWQRHRRLLLMGLAGLGVTVLAGSVWEATRSRSPSPLPTPHVLGKRLHQLIDPNAHNWINQLVYSPDGSMIAAASGTKAAILWNIQKNVVLQYYPTLNQWVNDVSWSQTSLLATASGDLSGGSVQVWRSSSSTNKPVFTLRRDYSMRTVSWSPQADYLAFAGHSATVEVWNPITARPMSRYSYSDQSIPGINRVKWSFDARYIAAADDSGTVHVWEALTGKLVTIYRGHQSRIVDIAWRPGKYLIASASTDKTAHVWDALSGRAIVTYTGHRDEVHGIDWSPNGKYLVSGSYDTTVQVWEALTGRHIDTYQCSSKVLTICWSTKGNLIALGSQERGIEVLQATQ